MNVSDMFDDLDDHGFDDASDERKLAMLNDAYYDACTRSPWPFLEKTVVLTFDGSSSTPVNLQDLPATLTDFHAAVAMAITAGATGFTGAAGPELHYIRRDDFLLRYGNDLTRTGTPQLFYFQAGVMNFYPIPPSNVQITMDYISTPAPLAADTEEADIVIPAQFHRAIIVNGALFKLYSMEDDTDIAPTFETYFENALARAIEFFWKNQYMQPQFVHPVDADDLNMDTWYHGYYGTP